MFYIYLVSGALALALGAGFTFLCRQLARRAGLFDRPDGFRKVHGEAKPRVGGVAIFCAFFGALGLVLLFGRRARLFEDLTRPDFLTVFLGGAAVMLIGLYDDIFSLRARYKLALLAAVSVGVYLCSADYRIRLISVPFGGSVPLGVWAMPVTVFWFLACMNAMNLIDGLDGLAGGVASFAAATILITSLMFGLAWNVLLSATLFGAIAGFLFFNFYPASIMLGDSGSYLLGFLVACNGLLGAQKSRMVVALLIPVIALGLPFMDTTLAVLRRWSRALPLASDDRQHIHHRLLNMGLTQRRAVLILYAGCFILACFALMLAGARDSRAVWLLVALGAAIVVAVKILGRVEIDLIKAQLIRRFSHAKDSDVEVRTAAFEAMERMRHVESETSVWDILCRTAERMEVDSLRMTLRDASDENHVTVKVFHWVRPQGPAPAACSGTWSARLALRHREREWGELEAVKSTNGHPLSPGFPEMMDLLAGSVAENLCRIALASRSRAPRVIRLVSASAPCSWIIL